MRDYDFEKLVKDVAVETDATRFPPKLQPTDYFVQNVVDLQDLLALRHCVFVIGLSGNNKSSTWATLAKCWTKGGVMGKTTVKDINPKSVTPNELYGYINMATREWKDGLLSSTMRDLANAPDSNPKWIILDGDLDANWIENMNSVMDDNRLLTLASNERIRLLVNMKMMFEIRDLVYASPATVTRAGVLFISDNAQWKNYVQSWIDAWIAEMPVAVKADARALEGEAARRAQQPVATGAGKHCADYSRFDKVVDSSDDEFERKVGYEPPTRINWPTEPKYLPGQEPEEVKDKRLPWCKNDPGNKDGRRYSKRGF